MREGISCCGWDYHWYSACPGNHTTRVALPGRQAPTQVFIAVALILAIVALGSSSWAPAIAAV